MYTLYWHPLAASLAPMAVLEETGVAFDLHRVNHEAGEADSSAYRQLQPLGLVPALTLPDGGSLFESAAIVQFLSDRHAAGVLAPRPDEADRARYLQWLHFMAGTLYPTYNRYYWPAQYSADAEQIRELRAHNAELVLQHWQVIETALQQQGPWLLGARFSSCDIYLQMMTTWHQTPADLLSRFPNVREVAKAVLDREACRRAVQRHDFQTGFEDS